MEHTSTKAILILQIKGKFCYPAIRWDACSLVLWVLEIQALSIFGDKKNKKHPL